MRRCPIMSGTVAPCFSASARNCAASSRITSPLNATIVRDPEAVEDREQQQGIFGRLSERFGLFDQQTCPLRSRLGFRCGKPFDMEEWGYERDLKLDLLATQRGSGRQGRDLVQGSGELRRGFNQRRALQRPLSRLRPPFDGRFGEARLAEVMCQQLGLDRSGGGEIIAQDLGDAAVQNLAPAFEQVLISRILDQAVFEAIIGFGRHALDQQDVGFGEPLQPGLQRRVLHPGERAQEPIGEAASDH